MAKDCANQPWRVVQVGQRSVGLGQEVYAIAEAGVNHNGKLDTALEMVDAARAAGADAVKFQVFKATRLASRHAQQAAYQQGSSPAPSQAEMLARLELQPADFARIKRQCDKVGIEFLATPFSPEDLDVLLDLGIRAVKIASPDIVNKPLLQAAARSQLPILLSTGASEPAEIDQAYGFLRQDNDCPLVLLHCVSSYPTTLEQANLRRIGALLQRYGWPVGFSDHTTELHTALLAVASGACLLEKHFTLDRGQPGPDHAFSLSPTELADYVRQAHQAQAALGDGSLGLGPSEVEVRRVSRCSVTAACDIPAGVVIGPDMLTVKRPGTGITPWRIEMVAGCRAKAVIPADTPITWEMIEESN